LLSSPKGICCCLCLCRCLFFIVIPPAERRNLLSSLFSSKPN